MSGRGERSASRGVKCQAGWHTKGQAHGKQGDLQSAFLQDGGVSLSCQHGIIKPKLYAAICTSAPGGGMPRSAPAQPCSQRRGHPGSGASLLRGSPVLTPWDWAGREGGASLLFMRK